MRCFLFTVNSAGSRGSDYDDLDFRLVVDSKSGPPLIISLVAPTLQDKAAWTSDISQVSKMDTLYSKESNLMNVY